METSERDLQIPAAEQISPAAPMVSIVIPAYNEAFRITPSLHKISRFLQERSLSAEVILVDDGSTDETFSVAAKFPIRVLRNTTNRGKGYSVRRGILDAKGVWVLLTDADLSAPIEELDQLWDSAVQGVDVAIGSRAIDRSKIAVHQSRFREAGGVFYNWMVRLILGLPIRDTQCGFKLFLRESVTPIFERQTIDGFGFDPEILFLAKRRGLEIREIPVAWGHEPGSKVRSFRDGPRMFLDLVRIRWNWLRGKYR